MYCAEGLIEAFPDAKIVQIIRDGRDVVAGMLSDPEELAWFRRGIANVDSEFPNPFFGTESEEDRAGWEKLSPAGKCAMRWRGSVTQDGQAPQLADRRAAHYVPVRAGDRVSAGHRAGSR